MKLNQIENGFELFYKQKSILCHTTQHPAFFVGIGEEKIASYRGNFQIEDRIIERLPLKYSTIKENTIYLSYDEKTPFQLKIQISPRSDRDLILTIQSMNPSLNRFWLRLVADENEKVWGGGEQMSYFNMKGRHFPLWTSEPGVGRDKTTEITFLSDKYHKAGGDYYHTNYPQPTFISSQHYACHINSTAYSEFDFRHTDYHELHSWEIPKSIEIYTGDTFLTIVEKLSLRFGRQPKLPEWIYNGVILGLKGGEKNSFSRLDNARAKGVPVAGIWCEDWAGVRQTSFGKRLFWDWKWNPKRYPNLAKKIKQLKQQNIRFLAYVSPYLCDDGELFPIAKEKGLFALNAQKEVALVDFGEFYCGVLDFTNPKTREWFKQEIIQKNMLDLGVSGWMADFGEYLPTDDLYLANGMDAKIMHNAWPPLWARVNAEAVEERALTGEILFFMRAGFTGSQQYCPMLWAGDQCVDFSRHDGLNTVICGALSSGLLGNAYHHSDIGGYTSLFGHRRTKEVFERWVDMAAFTPMMRTHEGNRPDENFQFDQDSSTIAHLARMTKIYCHLVPYLKSLVDEAYTKGYPVQRPLFVHFEQDINTYDIQDQYMYGAELLVAPVHKQGVTEWRVYLPSGETWISVWTAQEIQGGQTITVPAPIGKPPLFYRKNSQWTDLFAAIADIS
ncbi:alpha-glucosidase [Lonepinella koalarum]|uniref:Alpha-glucosidase n=1 Tax=Lonepinella koalarum TaxID=53417 RepID=A0A4R1KPX4_9PAST|nr:alpha-glucosidase [Lonepinella koalarum]MDH2925754.1 alpha-glucosidase [Lonepinella koalarum]TCK66577.1 alpha-glucosidase [Lonepinella koalarum]TFJ89042.1 alpha-glucosidase [Lonepinella koalarum]TYG34882.1 alpha-glucosidase [Lonepinella koalarum]